MHRNTSRAIAAVASFALIVPATAVAATIAGGPEGERLKGTRLADLIDGNGGNDRRGDGGHPR